MNLLLYLLEKWNLIEETQRKSLWDQKYLLLCLLAYRLTYSFKNCGVESQGSTHYANKGPLRRANARGANINVSSMLLCERVSWGLIIVAKNHASQVREVFDRSCAEKDDICRGAGFSWQHHLVAFVPAPDMRVWGLVVFVIYWWSQVMCHPTLSFLVLGVGVKLGT